MPCACRSHGWCQGTWTSSSTSSGGTLPTSIWWTSSPSAHGTLRSAPVRSSPHGHPLLQTPHPLAQGCSLGPRGERREERAREEGPRRLDAQEGLWQRCGARPKVADLSASYLLPLVPTSGPCLRSRRYYALPSVLLHPSHPLIRYYALPSVYYTYYDYTYYD